MLCRRRQRWRLYHARAVCLLSPCPNTVQILLSCRPLARLPSTFPVTTSASMPCLLMTCHTLVKLTAGNCLIKITGDHNVFVVCRSFAASSGVDKSRPEGDSFHKRSYGKQQHLSEGRRSVLQGQEETYYHYTDSKHTMLL